MKDVRLILLDRDGTINAKAPEGEYVTRVEELEMLPGASRAIARLGRHGLPIAVVTNQRGIARGRMTEADLSSIHRAIAAELATEGGSVQAWLHCPHERDRCECRKPEPGMLTAALERFGVEPAAAVMIGDADSDVEAGQRAGVRTIRIGGGHRAGDATPDRVVADLSAAVGLIIGDEV